MPSVRSFALLAAAALLSSAAAHPHDGHDHEVNRALPDTWFQPRDHPVYNLFPRDDSFPEIGSEEWAAGLPTDSKYDVNNLPKEWLDALDAAVAAGKIPDIPTTTLDGNPVYPNNLDPMSPEICSSTYKCPDPDLIWDAPDGTFAASFDDGPTEGSPLLYDFLQQNNIAVTHFMIGLNILYGPELFKRAFYELQGDIAVHTWSHPYLTTLTNKELLAEFGYTLEIIRRSTNGRLAKFMRPPYGDGDKRVAAIAKHVFGLTVVIWNQDTEDWSIGQEGGTTRDKVNQDLEKWITGSKSPGLVILEHELTNDTSGAFMQAYPLIQQNGWNFVSLARMDGGSAYLNADGPTGDVKPASVAQFNADTSAGGESSSSSAAGSATSSTPAKPTSSAGSGVNSRGPGTESSSKTSSSAGSSQTGSGASQDPNSAASVSRSGLLTGLSALVAALVL
ncbi:hypothetical protein BD413DRAFT_438435, partial [Trametes elegans]